MCQNLSESFIEKHAYEVSWTDISLSQTLSEPFIEKHADKINWGYISIHQKLSESFIEKHADKVDWDMIKGFQKLSDDFCKKYNIESNILNIVHNCGEFNRCVFILKADPDTIHIGCFKGSKQEAIEAIKDKYHLDKDVMNDYIAKVKECFNY